MMTAHDAKNGEVWPMLFDGQTIKVDLQEGGIAELRFERGNEAVNKLEALSHPPKYIDGVVYPSEFFPASHTSRLASARAMKPRGPGLFFANADARWLQRRRTPRALRSRRPQAG